MAKAKTLPESKPDIELILTHDEALYLRCVIGDLCTGNADKDIQRINTSIYDALRPVTKRSKHNITFKIYAPKLADGLNMATLESTEE